MIVSFESVLHGNLFVVCWGSCIAPRGASS